MIRQPPQTTTPDPRFPQTTLFRSRQQHRRPAPVEIAVDDNLAAVQHRADPAGRQVVEAQRAPLQQGAQKLCRAGIAAAEPPPALLREAKIGRASWRERVCQYV